MNWWQSRRWLSNSIGLNGFSLALFPFRFVSLQHECFSFRFVLFNLLWNFPLCDDYLKFYFKWSVAESWNWKWGQKKPKWSRCDFHFSRSPQISHNTQACMYKWQWRRWQPPAVAQWQWHGNFQFFPFRSGNWAHTLFLHNWRNTESVLCRGKRKLIVREIQIWYACRFHLSIKAKR